MLLTQAGNKYVFGRTGEGLQRTLAENKIRATKLEHIFLTGPTDWSTVGGLPGFLLTAGDQGVKDITVHSANSNEAVNKMAHSWRHFVYHNKLDINIESNVVYEDETLSVEPVAFDSNESGYCSTTSYIIQILPSRGKFLVSKAKELGVPKGPLFRELTLGSSVTLESGRVVHSHEVMDTPKTPPRVLVIDCQDEKSLSQILQFDWYKPLASKKRKRDASLTDNTTADIKVVYHFLGSEIDPFVKGRYQDFISKTFDSECLHIISHPDYIADSVTFKASALFQQKLQSHFPNLFNDLYSSNAKKRLPAAELIPFNHKLLHSMDVGVLEPEVRYQEAKESSIETNSRADNLPAITEPRVVTLGTGSTAPSKYRNVASILFRHINNKSVMFDCGEGTLGTLRRLYGPEGANRAMQEMSVLYISHLHADHHLGAISIIKQWLKSNTDISRKLLVAAPPTYSQFLSEWTLLDDHLDLSRVEFLNLEDCIVGLGYDDFASKGNAPVSHTSDTVQDPAVNEYVKGSIRACSPSRTRSRSRSRNSSPIRGRQVARCLQTNFNFEQFGLQKVEVVRADHCKYAYCVSVTMADGFKVSYSGDTRPSPKFASTVGQNSDILIHEATHENELLQEAIAKRHSTLGEALEVGREMKAVKVILTHFSQRYPKLPEHADMDLSNVSLAFDGMSVGMSEIDKQVHQLPAFAQVLKEMESDEDDIA